MAEKHPSSQNTTASELLTCVELPAGWSEVHVAVAVSGGADSMSLLRVMQQLKAQVGGAGQLLAFHVNHQLRAVESADDARWLQKQCKALQVPLEVMTADTAQYAAERGSGLEAAARHLRYELLARCAEQRGVRYLATAHTRDDQVETILFRVLRGTGLRGLTGIPPLRSITNTLTLIRPLLNCTRQMVTDYLLSIDQTFRTDSSNADQQFTRNRLRHDLLPMLREQYNAQLDAALIRLAHQSNEAQSVIECLAEQILSQANLTHQADTLSLDLLPLRSQEKIIISEVWRLVWRKAGLGEQDMTYDWWRKLANFSQSEDEPPALNLPGNVCASIVDGRVVLKW